MLRSYEQLGGGGDNLNLFGGIWPSCKKKKNKKYKE